MYLVAQHHGWEGYTPFQDCAFLQSEMGNGDDRRGEANSTELVALFFKYKVKMKNTKFLY